MDYTIITKYLAGEASEPEIQEIFGWMEADSENRKKLLQYKKVWALTARANENQDKIWNDIAKEQTNRKSRFFTYTKWIKYAAAVLLIFAMGAVFQYLVSEKPVNIPTYLSDTHISVPAGQMSNVVLPDGTSVQLNSGSTLLYSANFNSGERIVSLEGEAFFDVAEDRLHPFQVNTKLLDFRVYGTSFNVLAYPDDREVNTTLIEGSLGVFSKTGVEFTRLVPGENIEYKDDTKEFQVSKVNVDLYTSWKSGLITFRNETLREIARKIERWYNVEIIIKNEKLADELYMGTIMKNKPVDQILEVFRLTSSMKYRIVQRPDKSTLIYWE
ncbi:MAG: hypothetical protein A2W90_16270 [Bacteroidetes bacterium GWF2_42_66]|nr:MAG: hypothetical protein A2W92_07690 [Bacteroidetes bacterium GWA2_42_15]OFX96252.1 MAG: hypothetical protein A2W89_05200 [Bacteroidetes bacterium GWE2_42_39]OFY46291.1 MAG: hypothetical protein A2W90_16270 [Bacteroidetes bacterium GWF2_42_66]HBL78329.1 hypothetical protein [Prolixibacteraceae bacterium]HCR90026.1 hypothetical protein [Prolixibacteraceae bacterium]